MATNGICTHNEDDIVGLCANRGSNFTVALLKFSTVVKLLIDAEQRQWRGRHGRKPTAKRSSQNLMSHQNDDTTMMSEMTHIAIL